MKKYIKPVIAVLMAAMLLQAGFAVFAAVSDSTNSASQQSPIYESPEDVEISEEVLDLIKASDPANYSRHLVDYKQMLVTLRVHVDLKQEIEKLLIEGYKLPEVLIGYEFLYHRFGNVDELRALLSEQSGGEPWNNIFKSYDREHPEFTPRSFASETLEKLMNTPSLSADDIMIADRFSFVTGQPFEDVIEKKQSASHWYEITAKAGLLYSADELPRVPITNEQLRKYKASTGWMEDRITAAFVLADQLGQDPNTVILKLKAGGTPEEVAAEIYEAKYR